MERGHAELPSEPRCGGGFAVTVTSINTYENWPAVDAEGGADPLMHLGVLGRRCQHWFPDDEFTDSLWADLGTKSHRVGHISKIIAISPDAMRRLIVAHFSLSY